MAFGRQSLNCRKVMRQPISTVSRGTHSISRPKLVGSIFRSMEVAVGSEKGLFKRISQLINRKRERGNRERESAKSKSSSNLVFEERSRERGEKKDWFEDKTEKMCALFHAHIFCEERGSFPPLPSPSSPNEKMTFGCIAGTILSGENVLSVAE